MLKSMTGFGTLSTENENYLITIEVKSLNSKFMDLQLKLPKLYYDKDFEIRNLITKLLERGKAFVGIELQSKNASNQPKLALNKETIQYYLSELQSIYSDVSNADLLKIAMGLPDTMTSPDWNEKSEDDWVFIMEALNNCLKQFEEFRLQEGAMIQGKLTEYIDKIITNLEIIKEDGPARYSLIRERITKHLLEVTQNESFDRNRFEQEMIYYIEKLDIQEEIDRLGNHLSYFMETLQSADTNGKKLGFIAQEIGREINTIGSKANSAGIQRLVVEMKEELEKIKEQSLNVL